MLLERREDPIQARGRRAAGSDCLLDPGPELALALPLGTPDKGRHGASDLLAGRTLEVTIDDAG
ncbi:MAG: hypothetical protein ACLP4R_00905 [Solirubrobacteraceae bacterium]